jgi:hypothetical protein
VSGGVDEVDEESVSVDGLLDEGNVLGLQLVVERDGSGLDGNATILLVLLSRVRKGSSNTATAVPYEYP